MEELYLHLTSDCNLDIFPENTANAFRVKLPQTLELNGVWTIALLDVDMPKLVEDYKPKWITLQSTLCAPSVYKTDWKPVLQRFYYYHVKKGSPLVMERPRYVLVNSRNIDFIDLFILDESGEKASFKRGHLSCTLHLIRRIGEGEKTQTRI